MSYIVTTRYAEGDEGSKILGIYDTESEAREILEGYKENAKNEILEIQYLENNLKLEDIQKVRKFRTPQGDNFIKADGGEYETQGEYYSDMRLTSTEIFSEEVNRY